MTKTNFSGTSNRPIPPHKKVLGLSAFIGALVFFMLAVYKPFGLGLYSTSYIKWICFGYSFITAAVVYVFESYAHKYLATKLNLPQWGFGYNAVYLPLTLFCTGVLNAIYTHSVLVNTTHVPGFWTVMWYTFLVGIIPTVILFFWNYIAHLEQESLNSELPIVAPIAQIDTAEPTITLKGSGSEAIVIPLSKLIL